MWGGSCHVPLPGSPHGSAWGLVQATRPRVGGSRCASLGDCVCADLSRMGRCSQGTMFYSPFH